VSNGVHIFHKHTLSDVKFGAFPETVCNKNSLGLSAGSSG